jgi:hypothetical protein
VHVEKQTNKPLSHLSKFKFSNEGRGKFSEQDFSNTISKIPQ